MALNLKNADVERLAAEVALLAGESKTEAVRVALVERRGRLRQRSGAEDTQRITQFLEREVWPTVPDHERGRRLSSDEEDAILGHGPEGM